MPEFDSYKTSTVSAELEQLLFRLVAALPLEERPIGPANDVVRGYLNGGISLDEVMALQPEEKR